MSVEAIGLGKTYGGKRAVNDLSFTLEPGIVTGFLGPNGSGKSTTMRVMLGLDRGEGRTLWNGKQLPEHPSITKVVGAHLDAKCFHPTRSAANHLRLMASEANMSRQRVDEVMALVGLTEVAKKKPKDFSLGMAQRLGLAGAILTEPDVLMLDEPANGLDPQSIHWLRDFLRVYAERGHVVFVSSHLLSEVQLMADQLVVIARGALVANEKVDQFVARSTRNDVLVRSSDATRLAEALQAQGIQSTPEPPDGLAIKVIDTDRIGDLAFAAGVAIRELRTRTASLEDVFLELTSDSQDFAVGGPAPIEGGGR
jgi:ABC-2 type transport system ATP-binding protein